MPSKTTPKEEAAKTEVQNRDRDTGAQNRSQASSSGDGSQGNTTVSSFGSSVSLLSTSGVTAMQVDGMVSPPKSPGEMTDFDVSNTAGSPVFKYFGRQSTIAGELVLTPAPHSNLLEVGRLTEELAAAVATVEDQKVKIGQLTGLTREAASFTKDCTDVLGEIKETLEAAQQERKELLETNTNLQQEISSVKSKLGNIQVTADGLEDKFQFDSIIAECWRIHKAFTKISVDTEKEKKDLEEDLSEERRLKAACKLENEELKQKDRENATNAATAAQAIPAVGATLSADEKQTYKTALRDVKTELDRVNQENADLRATVSSEIKEMLPGNITLRQEDTNATDLKIAKAESKKLQDKFDKLKAESMKKDRVISDLEQAMDNYAPTTGNTKTWKCLLFVLMAFFLGFMLCYATTSYTRALPCQAGVGQNVTTTVNATCAPCQCKDTVIYQTLPPQPPAQPAQPAQPTAVQREPEPLASDFDGLYEQFTFHQTQCNHVLVEMGNVLKKLPLSALRGAQITLKLIQHFHKSSEVYITEQQLHCQNFIHTQKTANETDTEQKGDVLVWKADVLVWVVLLVGMGFIIVLFGVVTCMCDTKRQAKTSVKMEETRKDEPENTAASAENETREMQASLQPGEDKSRTMETTTVESVHPMPALENVSNLSTGTAPPQSDPAPPSPAPVDAAAMRNTAQDASLLAVGHAAAPQKESDPTNSVMKSAGTGPKMATTDADQSSGQPVLKEVGLANSIPPPSNEDQSEIQQAERPSREDRGRSTLRSQSRNSRASSKPLASDKAYDEYMEKFEKIDKDWKFCFATSTFNIDPRQTLTNVTASSNLNARLVHARTRLNEVRHNLFGKDPHFEFDGKTFNVYEPNELFNHVIEQWNLSKGKNVQPIYKDN
jgi:predicted nuclease with TOPRIM domain